jgi:ATP-binding cassette subfamily C (CFTR/MRP) protein 1
MVLLSSPYLVIFMLVYFVIIIRIRSKTMKAFVEMTRVNSAAKSPIMTLFSDCINGLIDIRTNNKQSFMIEKMSQTVDFHFKTWIILSAFGEWFRMRVNLLSTLFIIPAFGLLVTANDNFLQYASILVSVIMMNMDVFMGFMNSLNNIEKNFVAFDRCNYYLNLQSENGLTMLADQYTKLKSGVPMKEIRANEDRALVEKANWPTEGRIVLKDLKVKYAPELDYVLNGLTLEIKPGEKIGVIGRTGAGKTSLVTCIMRFFESIEGEISIDGVNIYQIDIKRLRRSLTFISQDSYFFEGTLRENLDPLHLKTDQQIIDLLKESEIFDKVTLAGGLDWQLSSGGGNLSVGEKQILCFVRAIINLKKVVILDEATSNLDIKSESLLEKMKDKYFKESTTITIAHRLNTVYQSDRILVLEKGRVKSFANVKELTGEEMEFFDNYVKQMIL